jgi:hypothetical protein
LALDDLDHLPVGRSVAELADELGVSYDPPLARRTTVGDRSHTPKT